MSSDAKGGFVIIAEFAVKPEHFDEFKAMAAEDARLSVTTEAGCHQFDVCVPDEAPSVLTLYEVYDDEAAFEVHRQQDYVQRLVDAAETMATSVTVRRLTRHYP